jgi:thiol peroxidase
MRVAVTVSVLLVLAATSGCGKSLSTSQEATSMTLTERPGVIKAHGNPLTLLGPDLKVGAQAPEATVVDAQFKPVKLSDFKGKTILISTVPSLDTTVCSMQTKRFNDEAETLPANVVVLTISQDLPFAQSRFCGAENIRRIRVLSDHVHREFGERFGVLIKENALLARSIWVVGPQGKITYREIVPELTQHPDYEKALAAVK